MIAIIDYGMGNLRSVQKALQIVGGDARIVQSQDEIETASKIVLPGVGAFRDAIARLREHELDRTIVRAIESGVPFLGICLGLQLLFDVSYEDGMHTGLGVLPGKVVRFDVDSKQSPRRLPVPHIGWNRLRWSGLCPLMNGIDQGEYMYFVHSYYVVPLDDDAILTATEYGHSFTSSVWRDNVFATQFHPEKSQSAGLRMLENFVRL